jgi:hypothetical protein
MPARALHPTTANAKKNYPANALKLDPSPNLSPFTGRGFELNFLVKKK